MLILGVVRWCQPVHGYDVRRELLSWHADEWANLVTRWIVQCRPLRREQDGALIPRAADVAMLLQMLVGAWPLDFAPHDDAARAAFAERLAQWQEMLLDSDQKICRPRQVYLGPTRRNIE